MALSIKNRELEEISRELARVTGKPITEALLEGAKRELQRQKQIHSILERSNRFARAWEIAQRVSDMPDVGTMTDDEILGYDEFGVPTK